MKGTSGSKYSSRGPEKNKATETDLTSVNNASVNGTLNIPKAGSKFGSKKPKSTPPQAIPSQPGILSPAKLSLTEILSQQEILSPPEKMSPLETLSPPKIVPTPRKSELDHQQETASKAEVPAEVPSPPPISPVLNDIYLELGTPASSVSRPASYRRKKYIAHTGEIRTMSGGRNRAQRRKRRTTTASFVSRKTLNFDDVDEEMEVSSVEEGLPENSEYSSNSGLKNEAEELKLDSQSFGNSKVDPSVAEDEPCRVQEAEVSDLEDVADVADVAVVANVADVEDVAEVDDVADVAYVADVAGVADESVEPERQEPQLPQTPPDHVGSPKLSSTGSQNAILYKNVPKLRTLIEEWESEEDSPLVNLPRAKPIVKPSPAKLKEKERNAPALPKHRESLQHTDVQISDLDSSLEKMINNTPAVSKGSVKASVKVAAREEKKRKRTDSGNRPTHRVA